MGNVRSNVPPGATCATRNVRRRVSHSGGRCTTHQMSASGAVPPLTSFTVRSPVFGSGATVNVTPGNAAVRPSAPTRATRRTSSAIHAPDTAQPASRSISSMRREKI